ncbi:MAG: nitroreductase family deazaflavin-dependent oxidoreductase [Chloroflexi bacterium]|nr:nitroreductase family deazaflavin-dependent oxidoreductase [Chloroflexota bacterium]
MTTMTPQTEQQLRQLFKVMNKFVILLWRLGIGPSMGMYPEKTGQFLVIVHTGRKTGKTRYTPVNYARVEGKLYVTAGFGEEAHWYKNITTNPNVEVWVDNERWGAVAEDVSDHPDRLPLLREVLKGSGFAAVLAGVNPRTLNDAELNAASEKYRLIHLRRCDARTGDGGPGDLVWVWPNVAGILLALALVGWLRRR